MSGPTRAAIPRCRSVPLRASAGIAEVVRYRLRAPRSIEPDDLAEHVVCGLALRLQDPESRAAVPLGTHSNETQDVLLAARTDLAHDSPCFQHVSSAPFLRLQAHGELMRVQHP